MRFLVMLFVALFGVSAWGQQWVVNIQDDIEVDYGSFVHVGIDAELDGQAAFGGNICVQADFDDLEVVGWTIAGCTLLNLNGDAGPVFVGVSPWALCPSGDAYSSFGWVSDFTGQEQLTQDGTMVKVVVAPSPNVYPGDLPYDVELFVYGETTEPCPIGPGSTYVTFLSVLASTQQMFDIVNSDEQAVVTLRVAGDLDFIRGDATDDGTVNLADPVAILDVLFQGVPTDCDDANDANDDGATTIGDTIYLLNYLFNGGNPPPGPFGASACNKDTTSDPFQCTVNNYCP